MEDTLGSKVKEEKGSGVEVESSFKPFAGLLRGAHALLNTLNDSPRDPNTLKVNIVDRFTTWFYGRGGSDWLEEPYRVVEIIFFSAWGRRFPIPLRNSFSVDWWPEVETNSLANWDASEGN